MNPEIRYDNPEEQFLYERSLRRESLNREINRNRLRYLRNSRTKLLNSVYAGEKPCMRLMKHPRPIEKRDGQNF